MRACGGLHRQDLAGPLLTYMTIKSGQELVLMEAAESIRDDAYAGSDSLGTLHFAHWVPFEDNHLAFFTIYDGDFEKYIQDFAEKTSMLFDAVFPTCGGRAAHPSARMPRRSISGHWRTTIRPSGSTAAIRASGCSTFEPCSPITSHNRPPLDRFEVDGPLSRKDVADLRTLEDAMSQSHLVIDFPIKDPADAKALTEELSPLMPDLEKVQDYLGTVHYSSLMVEGDEKLLFLSDIDGRGRRSTSNGSWSILAHCSTPSSNTWTTLRSAGNRADAVKWLKRSRPSTLSTCTSRTRTRRFRTSRRARVRRASQVIPRRPPC